MLKGRAFTTRKSAADRAAKRKLGLERLERRDLMAAGALDPSFAGGLLLADLPGAQDIAREGLVQPDGKVVAVGFATDPLSRRNFVAVRYNANGSLDTGFGNGGITAVDFGVSADALSV